MPLVPMMGTMASLVQKDKSFGPFILWREKTLLALTEIVRHTNSNHVAILPVQSRKILMLLSCTREIVMPELSDLGSDRARVSRERVEGRQSVCDCGKEQGRDVRRIGGGNPQKRGR